MKPYLHRVPLTRAFPTKKGIDICIIVFRKILISNEDICNIQPSSKIYYNITIPYKLRSSSIGIYKEVLKWKS
ncbi:hypothetical protein PIPA1_06610 [Pelosinus sp. IPA-1]|nr:hypothetical protein PIPA1_06610 [Pelosinus sp. IPA-1]